jgi:hypothetical protein
MIHKIETEVTNTQHSQMFLQLFQQGPNLLPKHLEERPSLSLNHTHKFLKNHEKISDFLNERVHSSKVQDVNHDSWTNKLIIKSHY